VPRSSHASWSATADRPDPLSLLEEQNCSRLHILCRFALRGCPPHLSLSPWVGVIMAQDLVATPTTGIQVQICGDAHLSISACSYHRTEIRSSTSMILTKLCQGRGMDLKTIWWPAS